MSLVNQLSHKSDGSISVCTCVGVDLAMLQLQQGVVFLTFSLKSLFSLGVSCDSTRLCVPSMVHLSILVPPTHVPVTLLYLGVVGSGFLTACVVHLLLNLTLFDSVLCVCVYVCVCEREIERETNRERGREGELRTRWL